VLDKHGKHCYNIVVMIRKEVKVHIVGIVGGNKTQREIAENVIYYMITKLMPRLRNIEIEVQLKKMNEDTAVGYCMMGDDKRQYEIEVSKDLSIKDFVMTLCHEMVHVKQYVRGEMDDWNGMGVARWKNTKVMPETNYYDLPWEKEAYMLQKSLAKDCWKNDIF
jgi:hypothetical protein